MAMDDNLLHSLNSEYLEQILEKYKQDKSSLSEKWQSFCKEYYSDDYDANSVTKQKLVKSLESSFFSNNSNKSNTYNDCGNITNQNVEKFVDAYRKYGHLLANTNPLEANNLDLEQLNVSNYNLPNENIDVSGLKFIDADSISLTELLARLSCIYAGSVGSEYVYIENKEEQLWIQNKLENLLSPDYIVDTDCKLNLLNRILSATEFEKYLAAKYPGAKRFGLDGAESLLVLLDTIVVNASKKQKEVVIGMAHRGRLNVLVNLLGKSPKVLCEEFEGKKEYINSGDVKYHQGFSADISTHNGDMHISLAPNPSHLEMITAVVQGSVRAKQELVADSDVNSVFAVAIHGDAAFAGQGIVMECLSMSQTRGYKTGGTIHVVINNQVGFTTSNPEDARSTRYCTDIAKMINAPVFHVNADDVEAVYKVATLALEYRNKFNKDVVIDLIGYRKFGHNESDEPSVTQPIMYQKIRGKNNVFELYQKKLVEENIVNSEQVKKIKEQYKDKLNQDLIAPYVIARNQQNKHANWGDFKNPISSVDTSVDINTLVKVANLRDAVPSNFNLHPLVDKIIKQRKKMTDGEVLLDWGYAETLAYASLLHDGTRVRLAGQDCKRGTFFHRHAVWVNQDNGKEYYSLDNLKGGFQVINSLLSELGVLGFEYGYSISSPHSLVIWEAQFGDFANGAQVIIDQFISSGEQKWNRLSGLVMLLPHGYEGQGPEHSSARLERYLQLCAENNMQVCIPTSPSQMFHLLRRQALANWRKPLIIITPKSLLRHKQAVSTMQDLAKGSFKTLLFDENIASSKIKKIILCSGKVYYDLLAYQQEHNIVGVLLVRVEQLYPLPIKEIKNLVVKNINCDRLVWCQEEPKNQGAWYYIKPELEKVTAKKVLYAGRSSSSSTAAGYLALHNKQQQELIISAFEI